MEIPDIYKGLDPTDITYKEYKPLYTKVKKSILEQFPEVRINDPIINRKIYEEIGYPMWDKTKIGNPIGPGIDAIPWQMNEGNRRGIIGRRKTQKKATGKRYKTTRSNLSKVKQEYFDEAGKLWDELVGNPKGSFTLNGKTFNNRLHYQNWEVKRQVALDEKYQKLNKTRGMTHGHAVPPLDPRARESRLQSFAEEASGNFSSQDKLPADYDARLKKANIPLGKDVAKVAVGTSETITDPLPSAKIEKILKTDSEKALALSKYNNTKVIAKTGKNIAKKGAKLAGKAIPYVGLGIAGGVVTTDVKAAVNNPSAKNFTKLGLSTFDAGLEVVDATTGGLSTPFTLALQLGTEAARHYLDNGAAKISTKDRRRYRHGKV